MLRPRIIRALAPLILAIVAAGALVAANRPAPAAAGAPSACTDMSVTGGYGFEYTGAVFIGDDGLPAVGGERFDDASVGVFTADGQGKLGFTQTVNLGGSAEPAQGTGTYSVNADCSGTATLNYSSGETLHLKFVLVEGGAELRMVASDPGTVVAGIAEPLGGGCGEGAEAGTYGYTYTGVQVLPDGTRDEIALVGAGSIDTAGNDAYGYTESEAGTIEPLGGSGSRSVNADCTGTAIFPVGSTTFHAVYVDVDGGEERFVLLTDPGYIVLGISQKQQPPAPPH